jgi:tetratricopeptide (TPR) repeat protein
MKRFTLMVFVMFVMLFGVMVGQIWGQEDFNTYYNRGIENYNKDRFREAVSDLSKAIQINPNSAEAYYYRARSYLRFISHDIDDIDCPKAISDLDKAIQLNPRYIEAYMLRGEIRTTYYKPIAERNKALVDFNTVITIDPNNAEAYDWCGRIYAKNGDLDRAMRSYNAAINIDPKYALAYYHRSFIYDERDGDINKTIADVEMAVRFNSSSIDAYFIRNRLNKLQQERSRMQTRGY